MKFMTDKGIELTLSAISPVLLDRVEIEVESRFEAEGEPTKTPTFQLQTVGGDFQTFELTEKNLNPGDPQEAEWRQAKWNAYLNAQARLQAAQAEARLKFLLKWAVDVDVPEDTKWQRLVRMAGVEIPDDPDELRFVYLWYHVLTMIEVQRINADLAMLAYGKAVSAKDVETFHQDTEDSLRKRARTLIARAIQDIAGASTSQASGTDLQQPAAERGESGESLGDYA